MPDPCLSDAGASCDNSQLIAAINTCCSTTNTNLTAINTSLGLIIAANASCCTEIKANQDTMISLLNQILANI
jgi:hypothetical protein